MFDFQNAAGRVLAAFSALAFSSLVLAFAIVPGSPAGVIA